MTLPGRYDLALYRGDSYSWQFVLWADEDKTEPSDLTGVTATAEIREKSGTTPAIPISCTVVPPNVINSTLSAANSTLVPTKARWDLQLTLPDGIRTVLAGAVTVTADITGSAA